MKKVRRTRSRFKNLLLSSAILAALSPAIEVNAQETDSVDSDFLLEDSKTSSSNEAALNDVLLNNKEFLINDEVSLMGIMDIAKELHLNGDFESALSIYNVLYTYSELDETVIEQVHTNEQNALNELGPIDWTLSDEQRTNYEAIIVLDESQVLELINQVEDTSNLSDGEEEILENKIADPVSDSSTEEAAVEEDLLTTNLELTSSEEMDSSTSVVDSNVAEEERDAENLNVENDSALDKAVIEEAATVTSEETIIATQQSVMTEESTVEAEQEYLVRTSSLSAADVLYNESINASSVTVAWNKALEGYNLYPDDARFKDALEKAAIRSLDYADSLEAKGMAESSVAYYDRTLNSPWMTDALLNRAQTSKTRILEVIAAEKAAAEEAEKEALYNASVKSISVTVAWNKALEGYNLYPDDARFKDALEKAAIRSLDYADSLEAKGMATSSIAYYDRTIDSPWMTAALIERAQTSKTRVLEVIETDKETLYNASIQSSSVTVSWNKALEGYNKYPDDARFKDALEKAATRSLNYADSLEAKGMATSSIAYYDRTIDSPWMTAALIERAQTSKTRMLVVIENDKETDRETLYNASIKASSVTVAWNKAIEGYNKYPDDARFRDAIEKAATRSLDYADSLEARGMAASSIGYYDRTLNSPWLSDSLRTWATNSKTHMLSVIEEEEKAALYNASIKASSVTVSWNKAVEGYNKYPDDARFKDAIEKAATRSLDYADSLEARGMAASSIGYYDRTLSSPWLSDSLRTRATTSKKHMLSVIEEEKKAELYNKSITSSSVSTAWYTAVEGYNMYPDDARFKDAIERAAIRSLDYADSLEARGMAASSIGYYDRTLSSPWLSDSLKKRATTSRTRMLSILEEEDKAALYKASISSSSVSTAWKLAVEGYNKYPNDDRFKDAIERAAIRTLDYADTLESKGLAASSIGYYDRILNSPWIPNVLYTRALNSKEEMMKFLDSDYVYREILNEKDTIKAWYVAIEAIVNHPDDTRIEDYIVKQADLLLSEAIALHKNYQYANAVERYNALIAGPTNLYDENITAEKYKILAKNNLIPNNASYQNSYYQASLDTALNEQMKRAPQTQSGGKWVNASKEQTLLYLNPDNFLSSIENDLISVAITGKVTASALNVRSGSGTGYTVIDQIFAGKEVTIINEVNGWLQVSYLSSSQTKTGWVSGAFVDQTNKESVTHEFTEAYKPIARINVATLNVRTGPGTNNAVFTTVSNGQRYEIVKATNNWYQIKFSNGQLGWVSGDFITVTNTLENELLQFLKLSGSSGINEAKLNEEIGNSGVLTGKGHVFLEASRLYNINEIYLLAHAKLETGNGSSSLAKGILVSEVDGKAVTPKVVYNMYGIAAFDSSPLKSGSEYAYKMGWDTVDKAIMGGAEWISKQYVNHATHKQDTLYKMRWNPLNPGYHQYATDIGWAYKQTHTLNTLVEVSQRYDLHLKFDMPVYNENN